MDELKLTSIGKNFEYMHFVKINFCPMCVRNL